MGELGIFVDQRIVAGGGGSTGMDPPPWRNGSEEPA
jgi:hypothetical protein